MIDIHAHVLPGLDDGARTLDESLEMLKVAAAAGTTDLVATPHASAQYPYDESRVQDAFRDLSAKASGLIHVHLGCDFHLNLQNLDDASKNPTKYTVNHGQYLLVELPDFLSVTSIRQQLQSLLNARIYPIITHPERNLMLQSSLTHLKQWVGDGCLVQVTAQSFLGRFGVEARRSAESLMQARLVHCIASDAHDCRDRTPNLSQAHDHVRSRWGKAQAQMLFFENPMAVISGAKIAPARKRLGFSFLR